jgi:hypothetical protein
MRISGIPGIGEFNTDSEKNFDYSSFQHSLSELWYNWISSTFDIFKSLKWFFVLGMVHSKNGFWFSAEIDKMLRFAIKKQEFLPQKILNGQSSAIIDLLNGENPKEPNPVNLRKLTETEWALIIAKINEHEKTLNDIVGSTMTAINQSILSKG